MHGVLNEDLSILFQMRQNIIASLGGFSKLPLK